MRQWQSTVLEGNEFEMTPIRSFATFPCEHKTLGLISKHSPVRATLMVWFRKCSLNCFNQTEVMLICVFIWRHWCAEMDKILLLQLMQKWNTYLTTRGEFRTQFSKALPCHYGWAWEPPLWATSWRARLEREVLPNEFCNAVDGTTSYTHYWVKLISAVPDLQLRNVAYWAGNSLFVGSIEYCYLNSPVSSSDRSFLSPEGFSF